jgi:hypothetical protein
MHELMMFNRYSPTPMVEVVLPCVGKMPNNTFYTLFVQTPPWKVAANNALQDCKRLEGWETPTMKLIVM